MEQNGWILNVGVFYFAGSNFHDTCTADQTSFPFICPMILLVQCLQFWKVLVWVLLYSVRAIIVDLSQLT
eukprot:UN14090